MKEEIDKREICSPVNIDQPLYGSGMNLLFRSEKKDWDEYTAPPPPPPRLVPVLNPRESNTWIHSSMIFLLGVVSCCSLYAMCIGPVKADVDFFCNRSVYQQYMLYL